MWRASLLMGVAAALLVAIAPAEAAKAKKKTGPLTGVVEAINDNTITIKGFEAQPDGSAKRPIRYVQAGFGGTGRAAAVGVRAGANPSVRRRVGHFGGVRWPIGVPRIAGSGIDGRPWSARGDSRSRRGCGWAWITCAMRTMKEDLR